MLPPEPIGLSSSNPLGESFGGRPGRLILRPRRGFGRYLQERSNPARGSEHLLTAHGPPRPERGGLFLELGIRHVELVIVVQQLPHRRPGEAGGGVGLEDPDQALETGLDLTLSLAAGLLRFFHTNFGPSAHSPFLPLSSVASPVRP